jgi:hypothetical protein
MRCHACGFELEVSGGERVGFHDICEGCRRDSHVCRNCVFHDGDAYNECREPNAERVSDRDRANRCEYFSPGSGPGGSESADADREALQSLFKK